MVRIPAGNTTNVHYTTMLIQLSVANILHIVCEFEFKLIFVRLTPPNHLNGLRSNCPEKSPPLEMYKKQTFLVTPHPLSHETSYLHYSWHYS